MITLYVPQYRDLWFRQALLADEATMAYNHAWGGTLPFPEEAWADWYAHWIVHTDGRRLYRYVCDEHGTFVGEIAYHFDKALGGYVADVIIHARYRGLGLGGQALDALCEQAIARGITVLYDDIAIDNPAVGLFQSRGFVEQYRTADKIILQKVL